MKCFQENSTNPKEMWKTINRVLNKKSKTTNVTELSIDNATITDAHGIANTSKEYSANLGPNLAHNMSKANTYSESYIPVHNTEFQLQSATECDMMKILMTVKPSKSTGHNRIPPKLIKDAANVIPNSLTKIFNKSISTGSFPEDLKTAIVCPIYKSGNKTERENYRPMSVLSIIAKIGY